MGFGDTVFPMAKKNNAKKIDPDAFSEADVRMALVKNYFDDKKIEPHHKEALNFLLEIALFNLSTLKNNNL